MSLKKKVFATKQIHSMPENSRIVAQTKYLQDNNLDRSRQPLSESDKVTVRLDSREIDNNYKKYDRTALITERHHGPIKASHNLSNLIY